MFEPHVVKAGAATLTLPASWVSHPNLPQPARPRFDIARFRIGEQLLLQYLQESSRPSAMTRFVNTVVSTNVRKPEAPDISYIGVYYHVGVTVQDLLDARWRSAAAAPRLGSPRIAR
jgi:hypothetical protein